MIKIKKQTAIFFAIWMVVVNVYSAGDCACDTDMHQCCDTGSQHPVHRDMGCDSGNDLSNRACLCTAEVSKAPVIVQSSPPDSKKIYFVGLKNSKVPWDCYSGSGEYNQNLQQRSAADGNRVTLFLRSVPPERHIMLSMAFLI